MRGALTIGGPGVVLVPVGPLNVELESSDESVLRWASELTAASPASRPTSAFRLCVSLTSEVLAGPTAPTLRNSRGTTELAYHGLRAVVTASGAQAMLSVAGAHVLGMANVARGQRRLANLLRLVSEAVLSPTPVALHGAGVISSSSAYAFVGPRGVGKTTLARRFEPSSRLGDDHLWAMPERDGYTLWRTPFAGREGTVSLAVLAPLRAVAILEQGRVTSARRLSPSEALSRLLPAIVLPWADDAFTKAALNRAASLVESVPIVALALERLGAAVDAVESCL